LNLVRKFLKTGILEDGIVRTSTAGTPQGGVVSPLMTNIYLNYLDKIRIQRSQGVGVLVRYTDNLITLCCMEMDAKEALKRLGFSTKRLEG